jgi:hypothetical protein
MGKTGALNDMCQIIYQSLVQLLNGVNPYSLEYELYWGTGTFIQPMNYGPITLLMFLPAMIFPQWIGDYYFWIGGFIMINIYCYLIAETLQKVSVYDTELQYNAKINLSSKDPRENRYLYYCGVFFWGIPFGTMIVTVYVFAPIWLCLLAFHYRANPWKSGLLLSMACFAYQLCFLFVPVYIIYHFKKEIMNVFKFGIASLPSFFLMFIFEIWPPGGVIDSLFLYTSRQGYIKCPECDGMVDWLHGSLPKILYTTSNGEIQIGNQARIVMFVILSLLCVYFFLTKKHDAHPELFMNWYFAIAVALFTLTTNYGGIHYLTFIAIPLFYVYQIKHPDYRKNIPIGKKMKQYDQFDEYLLKYHQLPQ